MKYKYTYNEWSQDTRKYEIESNVKLSEEEIIDIACSTSMNENSMYKTKNFSCKFKGVDWGDDAQFKITGDTK